MAGFTSKQQLVVRPRKYQVVRTGKTSTKPPNRVLPLIFCLTFIYFVVELVVGFWIGSLALQADAFHMASDVLALGVALSSEKMSRRAADDVSTFGYGRYDTIGAFANTIFLVSSCLFIVMESVHRFLHLETVSDLDMLMVVGGVGLVVNLVGIGCLHLSGASHGHSHSHGGTSQKKSGHTHDHSHDSSNRPEGHDHDHSHDHSHDHDHNHDHDHDSSKRPDGHDHGHGVRGVLLHLMGDTLGSLGVIVSGIGMRYWDSEWNRLLDPLTSLWIVSIILYTTLPLLRDCIHVLLQNVPEGHDLLEIENEMIGLESVEGVHDLHLWQLTDDKLILTAHVCCLAEVHQMPVLDQVKERLHRRGIHSSTIQLEYCDETCDHPKHGLDCHDVVCPGGGCGDRTGC